jgi:dihydrofolate reductase/thymidylate synthase
MENNLFIIDEYGKYCFLKNTTFNLVKTLLPNHKLPDIYNNDIQSNIFEQNSIISVLIVYNNVFHDNKDDKNVVNEFVLDVNSILYLTKKRYIEIVEKENICENNIFFNLRIMKTFDINILSDESQYLNLIRKILSKGYVYESRNSVVKSVFGVQLKYNLKKGFPILTTKKVYWKGVVEELLWILRGETNVQILKDKGVHIWDSNSSSEFLKSQGLDYYKEGDIGPGYGFQMRNFGSEYFDCNTVDYVYNTNTSYNDLHMNNDQLFTCIQLLKTQPNSRRNIISLWNPLQTSEMVLPPCHVLYHFITKYDSESKKYELSCHLFQRSWDVFLGWNTTTAALFTHILAKECGMNVGKIIHSITDAHLYKSHMDDGCIDELLKRNIKQSPRLVIKEKKYIRDYVFEDFELINYNPHPIIKAKMIA